MTRRVCFYCLFVMGLFSLSFMFTGCSGESDESEFSDIDLSSANIHELEIHLQRVSDYATSLTQSVEEAKIALENIKEKSLHKSVIDSPDSHVSMDKSSSCKGIFCRSWIAFITLIAFIGCICAYIWNINRKLPKLETESEGNGNTLPTTKK